MLVYIEILRQKNTFLFERLTIHHYINTFSNHPPTIIKQLPKMVRYTISDLSCNKEEFDKVKSVYNSALKDSGHFSSMSYNNSNTRNARRNRNRKVIWFSPPYSQNMKTNIGKLFIKLMRKHFPKNNKYDKSFNVNTLKLSYFCTTGVWNIKQHNSKVLSKTYGNNSRKCNCRSKPYKCGSNPCDLYLLGKVSIIRADPGTFINKRTWPISTCHHRNKFLLAKVKKWLSWYGF